MLPPSVLEFLRALSDLRLGQWRAAAERWSALSVTDFDCSERAMLFAASCDELQEPIESVERELGRLLNVERLRAREGVMVSTAEIQAMRAAAGAAALALLTREQIDDEEFAALAGPFLDLVTGAARASLERRERRGAGR